MRRFNDVITAIGSIVIGSSLVMIISYAVGDIMYGEPPDERFLDVGVKGLLFGALCMSIVRFRSLEARISHIESEIARREHT